MKIILENNPTYKLLFYYSCQMAGSRWYSTMAACDFISPHALDL